ncbi:MAG: hypothetical protein WDO71_19425 [Bacteroidota bacterium]
MLDDMTPDQGQYAGLDKDANEDGVVTPDEKYSTRPYNIFSTALSPFRHP